jgi:23S rRNA pseudouridine1911/1915/1917 synthase
MGAKAKAKDQAKISKLDTEHREPGSATITDSHIEGDSGERRSGETSSGDMAGEGEDDGLLEFDASEDRIVEEEVPGVFHNERLDRIVAAMAGAIRSDAAGYVDAGRVRVNGTLIRSRSRKVREGDVVTISVPPLSDALVLVGDPSVVLDVVYEDADVIVINKPAGLVVHPGPGNRTGTMVHGLLARYPELGVLAVGDTEERPGIVHRLDKGTSGLLMVGRNQEAVTNLISQLAARTVSRKYLTLAWGTFEANSGLIDAPVGRSDADPTRMTVSSTGRPARTRYTVEKSFTQPDPVTLVECRLETGRTHQIRVHLAAIGHPVVGDVRYGGSRNAVKSPRPWLHARALSFMHPRTGEEMSFSAEVPAELLDVLTHLS